MSHKSVSFFIFCSFWHGFCVYINGEPFNNDYMKTSTLKQLRNALSGFKKLLSALFFVPVVSWKKLLLALLFVPVAGWAQCPDGERMCSITILGNDIFGDGWSGAGIEVWQGSTLRGFATLQQGYEGDIDIAVCSGDTVRLVWVTGQFDNDIYFSVLNGDGSIIITEAGGSDYANGQVITRFMPACAPCVRPSNLVFAPDSMSCLASWNGNGESAWIVYLDNVFQGVANTNSWLFNGLTPNTYYNVMVAAICGDNDTSFAIAGTFRTSCGPLPIPYFNTFDNETYDLPPSCWNTVIGYNDAPKVFDDMAYSDSLSLYFSAAAEGANLIATPVIPLPGNQINVTFHAFIETGIPIGNINLFNAELQAGVMSNPNNAASFIPLLTINLMDNQWHEYEYNTTSLPSDSSYYVAFRYTADNNLIGNAAIDNLHITVNNGCSRPAWTRIDSVAAHKVWLRWGEVGGASAYNVYVGDMNDPTQASLFTTVYDTVCVLNGLIQNSDYWVWVATACGDYESDYKPFASFHTTLTCAPVVDARVANVGYHTAAIAWQYDNLHGMPTAGTIVELYDLSDLSSPMLQDFTSDNYYTLTGLLPSHAYRALIYNTCLDNEEDTANVVTVDFMTESCSDVVGNGLHGTQYVNNCNFTHSYIQSLYLDSEMPAIDTIRGLAFHFGGGNGQDIDFDVYLGQTSLQSLSTSSYVPFNALTHVGTMAVPSGSEEGWIMLAFDQPFVWNGSSNLAIVTHNSSGVFHINPSEWYYHTTAGTQTVEWNNYSAISPDNPSSYFSNSYSGAPDVRFMSDCEASGCLAPVISHIDSDTSSIMVQWVVEVPAPVALCYRKDIETVWHFCTIPSTSQNSNYTITGTTPSTQYIVRVGAICDGDTLWDMASVVTPSNIDTNACMAPANLRVENTSDAGSIAVSWSSDASSWEISWDTAGVALAQMSHHQVVSDTTFAFPQLTNGGKYRFFVRSICGGLHSTWRSISFAAGTVIMAANSHDSISRCGVVVYDDGGAFGDYSSNNTSLLVINPESPSSAVVFKGGTFDINPWGGDLLRIFEGQDTNGLLLYANYGYYFPTSLDTTIVSELGSMTVVFQTNTFNIASGYELFFQCQPSTGCRRPRNLTASVGSDDAVTLTWEGNAATYDIYYRIVGNQQWLVEHSTTPSLTLMGLAVGTRYEATVQGRCSTDDISPMSETLVFNTACAARPITAAASVVESFEDVDAPPACWSLQYADGGENNPIVHSTDKRYSGLRSLRFSSYNASNDYSQSLISPLLAPSDSITLSFYYSDQMYGNEKMRVGFSTTDNNISSFQWVDTISSQGTPWVRYERDFPRETKFLAINYISNYSYYAYIDDVEISLVSSARCQSPVITNINDNAESITVFFNTTGNTEAYITDAAWNDDVNGVFVNGESYTFTGLSPRTTYTIGIRSRCDNGLVSEWVTRTVTTATSLCNPPDAFALDEVGYTSATFSWNTTGASSWEINIFNTVFNQSYIANASPLTVEGLTANIGYKAKIRAVCNGEYGEWNDSVISFVTPECEAVSEVTCSPDGVNAMIVTWHGSADSYVIEYGPQHYPSGMGVRINDVSGSQYRIEGLEAGMTYDVYVAARCAEGVVSNWSQRVSYTVPSTQGVVTAEEDSHVSIYPNPSKGDVTIEAPGAKEIVVVDPLGRIVRKIDAVGNSKIHLSNLNKGFYFIKIYHESSTIVKRLVIK